MLFATTLVPDWHRARTPLEVVATGLLSGLRVVLAVLLRRRLGFAQQINDADLDLLARLIAAASLGCICVYGHCMLSAWMEEEASRQAALTRMLGPSAAPW